VDSLTRRLKEQVGRDQLFDAVDEEGKVRSFGLVSGIFKFDTLGGL